MVKMVKMVRKMVKMVTKMVKIVKMVKMKMVKMVREVVKMVKIVTLRKSFFRFEIRREKTIFSKKASPFSPKKSHHVSKKKTTTSTKKASKFQEKNHVEKSNNVGFSEENETTFARNYPVVFCFGALITGIPGRMRQKRRAFISPQCAQKCAHEGSGTTARRTDSLAAKQMFSHD